MRGYHQVKRSLCVARWGAARRQIKAADEISYFTRSSLFCSVFALRLLNWRSGGSCSYYCIEPQNRFEQIATICLAILKSLRASVGCYCGSGALSMVYLLRSKNNCPIIRTYIKMFYVPCTYTFFNDCLHFLWNFNTRQDKKRKSYLQW